MASVIAGVAAVNIGNETSVDAAALALALALALAVALALAALAAAKAGREVGDQDTQISHGPTRRTSKAGVTVNAPLISASGASFTPPRPKLVALHAYSPAGKSCGTRHRNAQCTVESSALNNVTVNGLVTNGFVHHFVHPRASATETSIRSGATPSAHSKSNVYSTPCSKISPGIGRCAGAK